MKKNLICIALLTTWVMPVFSQVSNDNEDEVNKIDTRFAHQDFVPGQVLVKFKDANRVMVRSAQGQFDSTDADKITSVLKKYGTDKMEQLLPNENPNRKLAKGRAFNGETIEERDLSQLYCLKLSADHQHETMKLVEELNTLDEVEYAEPNYKVYAMADDNFIAGTYHSNPMVDQQWYLSAYGVKDLWDEPVVSKERPVIAIIDTGVDTAHPDLKDNIVSGYDFVNNTPDVIDDNMHGTHVAGIAAACNNGIGIIGANPKAQIMPIKVLDKNGSGDNATVLKGVAYAVDYGADILNLSLGGYGYSKAAADVYRNASLEALIVAAAGNDSRCIYASHSGLLKHGIQPGPSFPAAYSFVLGVQATDRKGALASFSNYDDDGPLFSCESSLDEPDGFNYELKAPGTEILSTLPNGKYGQLQGTSMASPLVAGAISALMMVKKYDNYQQLWGDLLHTDNIWQAYQMKERPANLELVRVMMRERKNFTDETEDAYSGYYEAHAGESVDIYPVVRCTLGEASNIKMELQTADFEDPNAVQILTGEVDFGWHLDAFGKAVSKNPVSVKIPNDIADARRIQLKLTLTCDEQEEIGSGVFTLIANNMETIHGVITEDMVLSPDHAYYVDDDLVVNTGVTLTILPGTRIEFAPAKGLDSRGKLVAKGTKEKPIVFAPHLGNGQWYGIQTPRPAKSFYSSLYTNNDSTLFTLVQTEATPVKINYMEKRLYYAAWQPKPDKSFKMNEYLSKYVSWWHEYNIELSKKDEVLSDPSFVTPAAQECLKDWKEYCSKYALKPTGDKIYDESVSFRLPSWDFFDNPEDTISFCKIEGAFMPGYICMEDCLIKESWGSADDMQGNRCVFMETEGGLGHSRRTPRYRRFWNFVNNRSTVLPQYSDLRESNFFNNPVVSREDGKEYWLRIDEQYEPMIDHAYYPSYLGTGREDLIRPHVYEMGNSSCNTYGIIDLSNLRMTPIPEAHGIVWKVVVNGKDAQDEFEDLAPLGVGTHKFEVYFNRPMNKAIEPLISFGVREPFTQQAVNENGSWNDKGTIYTAYKTITGTTKSDGICRIYVRGAEDNEFFECPDERYRFNVNVQAAGSMATGFVAEAGLGNVCLTWNNENNDFEDAMGFNIYRICDKVTKTIPGYRDENWQWHEPRVVPDTVRINDEILDIETTKYIDDQVTPGTTYYYLYKVLSTDLKEFDVSNIVAATPLTATRGDANGDGDVNVLDVMTTVNYILESRPKPFVYEAADMNADTFIDVLDVIGIVNKSLNPATVRTANYEETAEAYYTIGNDGLLYIETPVALAGLQLQISLNEDREIPNKTFAMASELEGFEQAGVWLSDSDYRLLVYQIGDKQLLPGKHPIVMVGDADITSIRLSDSQGRLVRAVAGDATQIKDAMGAKVVSANGVFNLNGQKISANTDGLKHGIYIMNGQKVVK